MSKSHLEALIEAAQDLSPLDQLTLMAALSESLRHSCQPALSAADFWRPKTLQEHIEIQQIQPVDDISSLRARFWPEDESADDLIDYIYEQRRQDQSVN